MSNNLIEQIKAILPNVTGGKWEVWESGRIVAKSKNYRIGLIEISDNAKLCALAPEMARYILEQDKPAEVEKARRGIYYHKCGDLILKLWHGDGWGVVLGDRAVSYHRWLKYCPECSKRLPTTEELEGMK